MWLGEWGSKLKRLYDAIENGVTDLADPMLKERVTELKTIRDQARADHGIAVLRPIAVQAGFPTLARCDRRMPSRLVNRRG